MIDHHFSKFDPNQQGKKQIWAAAGCFMSCSTYTNGDVGEAMNWMNQLDKEYELTDEEYGMGFYWRPERKGYIQENQVNGQINITS